MTFQFRLHKAAKFPTPQKVSVNFSLNFLRNYLLFEKFETKLLNHAKNANLIHGPGSHSKSQSPLKVALMAREKKLSKIEA